jgi:hypothetical protein
MIIDGIEVATTPVTMVKLDCGHITTIPGHGHTVGEPAECDEGAEGDCRTYDAIGCTIAELWETEVVPIVDVTLDEMLARIS